MVGYLVLIAAVALVAPANGPLRAIGRVSEPESVCANVVVHANGAIAAVLQADAELRRTVVSLRTIDLDEAAPGRSARLLELGRLAAEVNDDTLRAGGETKRLRALAQDKDAARAGDLRSFSDALDAALGGQHKMAVDLAMFLRYVDFRELQAQREPSEEHPSFGPTGEGRGFARAISAAPPTIYERPGRSEEGMARAAATDFEERTRDVSSDEARAAEHSEAAVTGC